MFVTWLGFSILQTINSIQVPETQMATIYGAIRPTIKSNFWSYNDSYGSIIQKMQSCHFRAYTFEADTYTHTNKYIYKMEKEIADRIHEDLECTRRVRVHLWQPSQWRWWRRLPQECKEQMALSCACVRGLTGSRFHPKIMQLIITNLTQKFLLFVWLSCFSFGVSVLPWTTWYFTIFRGAT